MRDDRDVNAGILVEGQPLNSLRAEMVDRMIRVLNGGKTKAEANGMDVFTVMTVHPLF